MPGCLNSLTTDGRSGKHLTEANATLASETAPCSSPWVGPAPSAIVAKPAGCGLRGKAAPVGARRDAVVGTDARLSRLRSAARLRRANAAFSCVYMRLSAHA